MPGLVIICGPTASGKSTLALEIARRLDTGILSADSRQVYREFDIGTAKPTPEERQIVPHELLDICDPTETLTVAEYQQQARAAIARYHRNGRVPLLVGGTGLYIKAIARGMKIPRVPPVAELRSQLAALGQSQCYAILQQVDPVAATKIHANDAVRTLRALEVYYVTGIPISEQQGENPPDYPILQIGLDGDPATGDRRIERRTHQMIDAGAIAEVEALCQKYGPDLPLLDTLGYGEIKQYLYQDPPVTLDETIAAIVLHTRQFAKRQRTWFRRIREIEWFDLETPDLVEKVWHRVDRFVQPL
ncbi:tRNA (adenosine(37)-N6)-dimethylallyltransferase MiaA [Oxynema sp. CENA135]|uniref:tRNA (adenosine(37)-N6)-dimethylallyltransferase MiaA n=1 Tax=Oxynema sp. CENA135 TaxID=984206 RepID=UPI00190C95E5|nr:tRNA (adenosine(37)-N6)-dimethylallyltransferase MiaA [Oxynema sp. CENA135]MBK4729188.1 tRNA (adenosine(37)-N6)-dimethylallyltransferase MiaA [Oxynema sp. CENA135]